MTVITAFNYFIALFVACQARISECPRNWRQMTRAECHTMDVIHKNLSGSKTVMKLLWSEMTVLSLLMGNKLSTQYVIKHLFENDIDTSFFYMLNKTVRFALERCTFITNITGKIVFKFPELYLVLDVKNIFPDSVIKV